MKVPGNVEKWGAAALGIASLLLLVNLVHELRHGRTEGTDAGARTRPASPAKVLPGAKVAAAKPKAPDELSRYDPIVKLDVLKETEGRPLAELHRDPFLFAGEPAPVAHPKVAGGTAPTPPGSSASSPGDADRHGLLGGKRRGPGSHGFGRKPAGLGCAPRGCGRDSL